VKIRFFPTLPEHGRKSTTLRRRRRENGGPLVPFDRKPPTRPPFNLTFLIIVSPAFPVHSIQPQKYTRSRDTISEAFLKTRNEALQSIQGDAFDVCVIGGGATGAACALDAQLRGLKTVLLDARDFAGATSSASTKLIHGGVRYLEDAVRNFDPSQYHLVKRSLQERRLMLRNGPYLSRVMEFLVPCAVWKDAAYYDAGLKVYDWIAGTAGLSPSRFLNRSTTLHKLPCLNREKLVGSVSFSDGQFDDARYNIALILTFSEAGGDALNYARVTAFEKGAQGNLISAEVQDHFTRRKFNVRARAFINATGPFSDSIRSLVNPAAPPLIRPSKGVHIFLPLEVMASDAALLIPRTEDGRVLFAIPWMGRLLVGTTDTEVPISDELVVTRDEVDYLLRHLNRYLARPVAPEQIVSGTAGIRPLVSAAPSSAPDRRDTKSLARDDLLEQFPQTGHAHAGRDRASGLASDSARINFFSIMGGKWTTHRAMAEDAVNAVQKHLLGAVTACPTREHLLFGSQGYTPELRRSLQSKYDLPELTARHLAGKFGAASFKVLALIEQDAALALPVLPGLAPLAAEVVYCARNEMAVTIDDILSRRLGLQLYSWRSAVQAAPFVASLLAKELNWTPEFTRSSILDYVLTINRHLESAGLQPEPPISSIG
jgi:glycerol-3-phosphate dehydrogenase